MKLTMLGTGSALVTECFNTCFVLADEHGHTMVDCGGGNAVLHQLKHAGLNWKDMQNIIITHKHEDHLIGVFWMLRFICQHMGKGEYQGDVNIYSHDEVIALIQDIAPKLMSKKNSKFLNDRVHFITVSDGQTLKINQNDITFFDIGSTKIKQFGFKMETSTDKSIVCLGDEPFHDCEAPYLKDCDWLLHEAFCMYKDVDKYKPYEKHHSTVKEACEIATKYDIKNLVLYHTEDDNLNQRRELYTAEGRQYFNGNLFVPNDLESIDL